MLRLGRKCSDSGTNAQTWAGMLRLEGKCSDLGGNAQTQGEMLRLGGNAQTWRECSDLGRNAQTWGEMLRLRDKCSDLGGNAQTQGQMLRLRGKCSDSRTKYSHSLDPKRYQCLVARLTIAKTNKKRRKHINCVCAFLKATKPSPSCPFSKRKQSLLG